MLSDSETSIGHYVAHMHGYPKIFITSCNLMPYRFKIKRILEALTTLITK